MNTGHKESAGRKFVRRQMRKIKAQFIQTKMAIQIAIHYKKPERVIDLLSQEARQLEERAQRLGQSLSI